MPTPSAAVSASRIRMPMMEKIVQTAKHTVKVTVPMASDLRRPPQSTSWSMLGSGRLPGISRTASFGAICLGLAFSAILNLVAGLRRRRGCRRPAEPLKNVAVAVIETHLSHGLQRTHACFVDATPADRGVSSTTVEECGGAEFVLDQTMDCAASGAGRPVCGRTGAGDRHRPSRGICTFRGSSVQAALSEGARVDRGGARPGPRAGPDQDRQVAQHHRVTAYRDQSSPGFSLKWSPNFLECRSRHRASAGGVFL